MTPADVVAEALARTEQAMDQTDKALANTANAIAALEAAVAAGNAWKAKAAEAEGRAERAEAAFDRIVREHWIEVSKRAVRSMEFDLERLYMQPAKPYGRVDKSARAQQERLRKIASDHRDREELPRLIAQTKAAIADAEKEAPRG